MARRLIPASPAIPQWIAVALLSLIGGLLVVIWASLDRRIAVIEEAFSSHLSVSQKKLENFAALEQRADNTERLLREVRATVEILGDRIHDRRERRR